MFQLYETGNKLPPQGDNDLQDHGTIIGAQLHKTLDKTGTWVNLLFNMWNRRKYVKYRSETV